MPVLEERGWFWWNSERVKPDDFAAEGYVAGVLKIADDGRITLDLDGCLPSKNQRVPRVMSGPGGEAAARNIQGKLRSSGKYALLLGAWDQGGQFSTNGISFERYYAPRCLVSDTKFQRDAAKPSAYRRLIIDMAGYEDWLWLQGIETNRTKHGVSARYRNKPDRVYRTEQGTLRLEYDLLGPWRGQRRERKVELTEKARLTFAPPSAAEIESMEEQYQRFGELLTLLSDSSAELDWPQVVSADGKRMSRLYFHRQKTDSKPPARHECLTNFPQIADDFGAIFSNWIRKREEFGPGFYLYLGTRRGMKLIVEHRFVNLIWGLEALDRRATSDSAHAPLQAKVDRVLAAVSSKDRRWLEGKLERSAEPSLKERLLRVLGPLPLPLDMKALDIFCGECAALRNDISHYGGERHKIGDYRTFVRELDKRSDALASMYHVLLLSEIGVKAELFDPKTSRTWPMNTIMRHLRAVGLAKGDGI